MNPNAHSHSTLLQVKGLTKRYGGIRVFDNVDLTIHAGEIFGVIGPNGAGKTTLINVLSGAVPPSAGTIHLTGLDVTGVPLHAMSRLGAIRSFQQTNTFHGKTVRENLVYAMQFGGRHRGDVKGVQALLDAFDLGARMNEPADKLPYGSQKLLGLLMAFVTEPQLLLLDEPAAGLEHHERDRIDRFVHAACRELGSAVLIVEHDIGLIRRLCSRIVMLDGGRILAEGTPDEVLSRPDVLSAYVGEADEEHAC
ncbi:ABC transporter ATP-binding protein [Diaphorobacter sp. HDW4A]|uniref:ABC transporter ATP-binding protein n=1 Tax=Diaphorobacter sp. HDW4A TaxID=2714924 RepID=UPI00140E9498|nr:ABC transporter ATP-binding protein [Diaphorobacter sp. HDW4A]QIL80185.1 ABC transporter ATP-binding protein [Diaphorobacter sp. HDW4A]